MENPQIASVILDWYYQQDAELIPLFPFVAGNADSKRPLDSEWTTRYYSKEQILQYLAAGHSVGWRLGLSHLIIDVDVKGLGEDDGREMFWKLCRDVGLDPTQTMMAWSDHGSFHCYLRKPETAMMRRHLPEYGKRVEFISIGSQVVIGGCQHFKGGLYNIQYDRIVQGTANVMDCPPALLQMLGRERVSTLTADSLELEASEIRDLLAMLDPIDYRGKGGEDWPNLMFAVHHACRGSEEGLQLFLQWCLQDPLYRDDEGKITGRWRSCTIEERGQITAGSLIKWARTKSETVDNEHDREARLHLIRSIEATHDWDGFEFDAEEDKTIVVRVGTDEKRMCLEVQPALTRIDRLYERGGQLVTVARQRKPPGWQRFGTGQAQIQVLPEATLRTEISEHVRFVSPKTTKQGTTFIPATIPIPVLKSLFCDPAREYVDVIRSLVTTPCMLPDGTILQARGFSRQFGVYYLPDQEYPPVPLAPSREHALQAVARLKEPLRDFPFVSNAHQSVVLAAMLTLVCRDAFDGPIPLIAIDGNMAAVGKSLLAQTVGLAMIGRRPPSMSCPPHDEEMEKRLVTIAMQDSPTHIIDNVPNNRPLEYPSLDQVLTASVIESRRMGGHDSTGQLEVRTMLVVTGNNIQWSSTSDTGRRSAYCRLDYGGEAPENRSGFAHGADNEFLDWVKDQHPQLVIDALTVLSAYVTAGRPEVSIPQWGSFGAWSDAIRKPLVWLGETDPYETRLDMNDTAGQAKNEAEQVLEAWYLLFGTNPASIGHMIQYGLDVENPRSAMMREVLTEILDPENRQNKLRMRKLMGQYLNRWINGLKLVPYRCADFRGFQCEVNETRQ